MKKLPSEEEFEKLSIIEKLAAILSASVMIMEISTDKKSFFLNKKQEDAYHSKFDKTQQQVGDIVRLTSTLATKYLWDEKHLKNRTPSGEEIETLLKRTAIVVEINCGKELRCNHCEHPHNVNTLIYFTDTKEKFYTMNEFLTSI